DPEAIQILGLDRVGIFALCDIRIESALDPAEQRRVLRKHLVLLGRYQHACLVTEDMPLLVCWHGLSFPVLNLRMFALYSPDITQRERTSTVNIVRKFWSMIVFFLVLIAEMVVCCRGKPARLGFDFIAGGAAPIETG